jgi:hypothetical protein
MKQLLTTALVLASLVSAQTVRADDACQAAAASQPETAAPMPAPIVISWDRVGSKEKWWV